QRRNHEANSLFQAALDPARDHQDGNRHEQCMTDTDRNPILREAAERCCYYIRVGPRKGPDRAFPGVGKGPACNDAVVRKNQDAGQDTDPADQAPVARTSLLLAEQSHRCHRVSPAAPPDEDLGHHHRHTYADDAEKVNEYERAPAVDTGKVGELPDVAEADCRPGYRKDERHAGRPVAMEGRARRLYGCFFFSHVGLGAPKRRGFWRKTKLLTTEGHDHQSRGTVYPYCLPYNPRPREKRAPIR